MNDQVVFDILQKRIKNVPGLVFVDLGAFLGQYAIDLHGMFPEAQIHAIEACPTNFKKMVRNCSKISQIIPSDVAITSCNCSTSMFVASHKKYKGSGSSQSNSLFENFIAGKEWVRNLREVSVSGLTMDDFCKVNKLNRIDYFKVNCEGCEYKMFEAESLDFLKMVQSMYLQMHSKSEEFRSDEFLKKRQRIENTMKSHGFVMTKGEVDLKQRKHIHQYWEKL